ncbi:hypothetical protein LZ633_19915 [Enterobacter asburiae]|nr:hypothetical protein [Enterobacter asburiae]
MNKYVFFIKENKAQVMLKEQATCEIIKVLKDNGYIKHNVEVEAENENDAIKKLNKAGEDNLDSLSEYSGNILIISVVVILMAVAYFFIN